MELEYGNLKQTWCDKEFPVKLILDKEEILRKYKQLHIVETKNGVLKEFEKPNDVQSSLGVGFERKVIKSHSDKDLIRVLTISSLHRALSDVFFKPDILEIISQVPDKLFTNFKNLYCEVDCNGVNRDYYMSHYGVISVYVHADEIREMCMR